MTAKLPLRIRFVFAPTNWLRPGLSGTSWDHFFSDLGPFRLDVYR